MMEPTSYSADKALAESLARLKSVEEDNAMLRSKLKQLTKDARIVERAESGASEGTKESERLRKQNSELMHVNSQWDLEYKDLDKAFQRYRMDSKQAQSESQSHMAKLKETKERMSQQIRELQLVISRKDQELTELRVKVRGLEEETRMGIPSRFGKVMVSQERVKELEEESHILRQQVKAYQDDFNAERKDRERMNEERETAAIRYEAEVTSLKLQLERCRNELVHYTSEANRLSQQLRLKSQIEEEQYKKHLESNGYITRSPSGHLPPMEHLPPLDPFVDIDEKNRPPPPRNSSPRLLTRGVDLVQAYSNSHGAQAYTNSQRSEFADSDRSRSPIMNGTGQSYLSPVPSNIHSRSISPVNVSTSTATTNGGFKPNIPPSMANGSVVIQPQRHNGYTNGYATSNGHGNGGVGPTHNGHVSKSPYHGHPAADREDANLVRPAFQERTNAPPLETKGRYSCPRCERKFESKKLCTDHKSRCMV